MIKPVCKHDKQNTPSATGWIITCRDHYEHAVRLNLLEHLDAAKSMNKDAQLAELRAEVRRLTSDLHDCITAPGIMFVRCECGRMRLKPLKCKGCGK